MSIHKCDLCPAERWMLGEISEVLHTSPIHLNKGHQAVEVASLLCWGMGYPCPPQTGSQFLGPQD